MKCEGWGSGTLWSHVRGLFGPHTDGVYGVGSAGPYGVNDAGELADASTKQPVLFKEDPYAVEALKAGPHDSSTTVEGTSPEGDRETSARRAKRVAELRNRLMCT